MRYSNPTAGGANGETPRYTVSQQSKANEKLGEIEDIEETLGIDVRRFATELMHVLSTAKETVGYTTSGQPIRSDYGYIIDFLKQIRNASSTYTWRSINYYFDGKHDWVLVQFREKNNSKFMGIPHLVEYRKGSKFGSGWYSQDGELDKGTFDYLNSDCEAVAFLEWEPYKDAK